MVQGALEVLARAQVTYLVAVSPQFLLVNGKTFFEDFSVDHKLFAAA
jgi:hypothetical protein